MKCPRCGNADDKVVDSRSSKDASNIRRRRECLECHYRFTTYERIEYAIPMIVKRDDRREPFNRDKVVAGLVRACEKRPISVDSIDAVADRVEARLVDIGESEIRSRLIGDVIMEELRKLDDIAYMRFASVYHSFDDIGDFLREAARVQNTK